MTDPKFEQWWATRTQEWIGTARNYPGNFANDVWNAALAAAPPAPEAQYNLPAAWKAESQYVTAVEQAAFLRGQQAGLERAALACEVNFKGCDKSNVACHKLDAEAIRSLAGAVETKVQPQGKHICCWERENPHRCILCCQCGKEFEPKEFGAVEMPQDKLIRTALLNASGLADALDAIIADAPQVGQYLPGLDSCKKNIREALQALSPSPAAKEPSK